MTPAVLASAARINLCNLLPCTTTHITSVFSLSKAEKKARVAREEKRQRTEEGNPVFCDLRHVNRRDGLLIMVILRDSCSACAFVYLHQESESCQEIGESACCCCFS